MAYKHSEETRAKLRAAWRLKKARGYKQFKVLGVEEQKVREDAQQRGDKYYFFQRPCKQGHLYKRFVKSTACVKCQLKASYKRFKSRRDTTEPEMMLYYSARQRARERGIEFSITKEDIKNVWPKDGRCPILGFALKRNHKTQDDSASLDCINPDKGYRSGNIAVISHAANRIKGGIYDPQFFEKLAKWVEQGGQTGAGEHICIQPRSKCACYRMWDSAKQSAKKRGLAFNLTPKDIVDVWPTKNRCPVSLTVFERNDKKGPCNTSPTLDKIKPELGYVKGNIAVISYLVNKAKNNITDPEIFRKMAVWIREHQV